MRTLALFLICASILYAETSLPLKGIALVEQKKPTGDFACDDLGIWIDPPLRFLENTLHERLVSAIGKEINETLLEDLKGVIADYFLNERHMLVSVEAPEQDISECVIQFVVQMACIDCVHLKGNRWTSDRWILARTKVHECDSIRIDQLERDLAWLNRSPFRRTDLYLRPGQSQGMTTVEFLTSERFPFRPYLGGDNTGTSFTSQTRWFTGFNAGNIWGWDHQASYQFTTTSEPAIFAAHSGSYTIPFPWRQELNVYGGWSRVKGKLDIPGMRNKGIYWQVSGRYEIPINPIYGDFLQEITWGYDFKRTNNGLIFESILFSNSFADINQFMVGYYFDIRRANFQTSFNIEVFAAPFKMTHYQTNIDYSEIRPFAKSKYAYSRARFSHTQYSHGFSGRLSLVGQGTGWNLMPSEQYGIGGYDTVRGYEERAFNADDAFLASLEITTPKTRLFDWRKSAAKNEKFFFLAFIDYGWGKLHKPFPRQASPEWLMGIGPGVRYSYKTNVFFRGDVGFPIHRAGIGRHGVHFHVGGTLSF